MAGGDVVSRIENDLSVVVVVPATMRGVRAVGFFDE